MAQRSTRCSSISSARQGCASVRSRWRSPRLRSTQIRDCRGRGAWPAPSCSSPPAPYARVRARHELAAVRRTADRLIVHSPQSRDASDLVRWRSDELTTRAKRESLRRDVERSLRSLDPARLPSASPLKRPAARRSRDLFVALAARLADEQPVAARGILLAQALLRDAASPLYAEDADDAARACAPPRRSGRSSHDGGSRLRRDALRRLFVGRPMRTGQLEETLLPKTLALPIFASDPLSSVAYATESALVVLLAVSAASAHLVFPISIAIAALLAVVVVSYMQTVRAYETSGGAYIVARENLGTLPSLVGAAALLTDYVLTVAVSISAGIFAVTSFAPSLSGHKVALSLGCLLLIVLVNLRGVRESGLALRAADLSLRDGDRRARRRRRRRARHRSRAPRGRAARAAGRHRRDHAVRAPARVLVRARPR